MMLVLVKGGETHARSGTLRTNSFLSQREREREGERERERERKTERERERQRESHWLSILPYWQLLIYGVTCCACLLFNKKRMRSKTYKREKQREGDR